MLEAIAPKAPDPLLKIIKLFRDDPRADKLDLGVGVYRDEDGNTPVMRAVKEAERRLVEQQTTKTYVGQQGDLAFLRLLGALAFGAAGGDMVAQQAVGGTGALRLGFDLLREAGAKRVILPTPSWPNHPALIAAGRLDRIDVSFFDVAEQRIDINGLVAGFAKADRGDAIILQACCHNPLGADFSLAHWGALAEAVNARGLVPFLDLAYQGFGDGIDEDVVGVRAFLERVPEAIVAVSGAKSFGLYRERVGALFVKTAQKGRAAVTSNLAAIARANYSMPPDHGAACVREVLSDPRLNALWRDELDYIRAHIKRTRAALAATRVNALSMHEVAMHKGMFSTLPLNSDQIGALRETHGIYMTDGARINVAGLREVDIPRFVAALNAVS